MLLHICIPITLYIISFNCQENSTFQLLFSLDFYETVLSREASF